MAVPVCQMLAVITVSAYSPQSAIYSLQCKDCILPGSHYVLAIVLLKLQVQATDHVSYPKVHYEHHIIVIISQWWKSSFLVLVV